VKDGVEVDLAESILDKFWSLQYMIPAGVLNGFAGPVKLMHAENPRLSMTHAVHLRFGSMQVGGNCSSAHCVHVLYQQSTAKPSHVPTCST